MRRSHRGISKSCGVVLVLAGLVWMAAVIELPDRTSVRAWRSANLALIAPTILLAMGTACYLRSLFGPRSEPMRPSDEGSTTVDADKAGKHKPGERG